MTNSRHQKYRDHLPQLDGRIFLTDGGLETTLIFNDGWDLPANAAFTLMDSERGRAALRGYFDKYIPMAIENQAGFVLETPTWRANPDWAKTIGYGLEALETINRASIELLAEIRDAYETPSTPIVISGNIGPRGDGYDPGTIMSVEEAEAYHGWQVRVFRDTCADLVSGFTITNANEAAGIARAAAAADMPCVISFTLETDGRLPSGELLKDAIAAVDEAADPVPVYYMINCAHPTHFDFVLEQGAPWMQRLRGLRANSSKLSHQELDNAPELDIGNPDELGAQYGALLRRFPHVNVLGGCCGTDHRHMHCISAACRAAA